MKVVFVCSGNTCRSPLAESLARKLAAQRGLTDVEFSSAGTGALEGGGASEAAILVGLERGVDLSEHRTRGLTSEVVSDADLVLVMSPHHLDAARMHAGDDKVFLLDDFTSRGETSAGVNDPFGGSLDAYRDTATELERQVTRLLDRLAERLGR